MTQGDETGARAKLFDLLTAKVAHWSLGEGGLTQSLASYGWQADVLATSIAVELRRM